MDSTSTTVILVPKSPSLTPPSTAMTAKTNRTSQTRKPARLRIFSPPPSLLSLISYLTRRKIIRTKEHHNLPHFSRPRPTTAFCDTTSHVLAPFSDITAPDALAYLMVRTQARSSLPSPNNSLQPLAMLEHHLPGSLHPISQPLIPRQQLCFSTIDVGSNRSMYGQHLLSHNHAPYWYLSSHYLPHKSSCSTTTNRYLRPFPLRIDILLIIMSSSSATEMTKIYKTNLGDHLQSSQILTPLLISLTPVAATAAKISQTAVTPHAHHVSRARAHASVLQDQTNALNAQGAAQSVFHQPLRNKKTQQAAAQLVGRLDLPPRVHARLQTRPATTALIQTNISTASQSDATSVLHYHLRSDVLHALSQSLK
jgi:hypothetical protein